MLYIVPTPIGNLGDLTFRALDVLKTADLIAAEDTRHTGILLKHYSVETRMISFHEHNEASRTAELVDKLAAGSTIALVTDAGMPGVSDPGTRLIRACQDRNLPYTILPGASAPVTALVGSGLAGGGFYFGGFLPVKSGGRLRDLTEALHRSEPTVFFESPHRLIKSLAVLAELEPDRLLCVARELSKKFEQYHRGRAADVLTEFKDRAVKGEICLIISGCKQQVRDERGAGIAEL